MQHLRTPHLLKNRWPTTSILFSLEYFDKEALYKPIYTGRAKRSSRDLSGRTLDVLDTVNLKDRCCSNQSSLSTSPQAGLLTEGNCSQFTSWFIHIASEDAKMWRHAYRCVQNCESRLLHLEMSSSNFHYLAQHSPRKLHHSTFDLVGTCAATCTEILFTKQYQVAKFETLKCGS